MISLAAAVYTLGATSLVSTARMWANGFRILAATGLLICLYIMSFSFFWEEWPNANLGTDVFSELSLSLFLVYSMIWAAGSYFAIQKDRSVLSDPFIWLLVPMAIFLVIGFQ